MVGGAGGAGAEGGAGGGNLTAFTTDEVQDLFNNMCSVSYDWTHTAEYLGCQRARWLTSPTVDFEQIVPGDRDAGFIYIKVQPNPAANGGNGTVPLGRPTYDAETIERLGLWIDGL